MDKFFYDFVASQVLLTVNPAHHNTIPDHLSLDYEGWQEISVTLKIPTTFNQHTELRFILRGAYFAETDLDKVYIDYRDWSITVANDMWTPAPEDIAPQLITNNISSADRRRSVIALCILGENNTPSDYHAIGRLTFNRSNGNNVIGFVDISMNKRWNTVRPAVTWATHGLRNLQPVRPCTFTYNGIKYGGITIDILESRHTRYEFHGTSTLTLFEVEYQRSPNDTDHPNEILNQEIYDSINFNDVTIEGGFTQNGYQVITTADTHLLGVTLVELKLENLKLTSIHKQTPRLNHSFWLIAYLNDWVTKEQLKTVVELGELSELELHKIVAEKAQLLK